MKANGYLFPCLNRYVIKRDKVLEQIQNYHNVSRWVAKDLFLRLMYLGKFRTWADIHNIERHEIDFTKRFSEGFVQIAEIIVKNNSELWNDIEKTKIHQVDVLLIHRPESSFYDNDCDDVSNKKTMLKRSVLSFYSQELENRVLEQLYIFCKSRGIGVGALCCDGMLISIENYSSPLLTGSQNVILTTLRLNLKFTEK